MEGTFVEVKPHHFLKYSWHWTGSDETTVVEVTFEDRDGETDVRVSHAGFESDASRSIHSRGWDDYFEGLTRILEGRSE
jgi:uncharacterized protein YndB with AHSA1/START domain